MVWVSQLKIENEIATTAIRMISQSYEAFKNLKENSSNADTHTLLEGILNSIIWTLNMNHLSWPVVDTAT